jgi:hypothetical protein
MQPTSIEQALALKKNGLFYGNRLLLPFKARILKIIIDDKIITDFSDSAGNVEIKDEGTFLSVYFLDYEDLREVVSKYELIKMVAVEQEEDVFDETKHKLISLYLSEPHRVLIELNTEDILFIE